MAEDRRMKVALACDHGGYRLKEIIKDYLEEMGVECVDFGTYSEDSVDYPDFAYKAARAVAERKVDRAILVCGTGVGICIVANKVKGIRAGLCCNVYTAEMSRRHNDTNVLCLGGRVIGDELAKAIVKVWLETPFDGGRHARRLGRLSEIEELECP
jgi:ribose 5-phosphate isomerase B